VFMLSFIYKLQLSGDHLIMGYFDNFDNEFLNKYEKKS
jgi:hypothetical protein